EMSIHHVFAAHASGPNPTNGRRIGFAIRYIPTSVRQTGGPPLTAMLVRGEDRHGHFELERSPNRDLDPEAVSFFEQTMERHRATKFSTV
ncbi:MAG: phytanoyl-CoA dioxygenase family protein, partial [Gammaproteobacteria bacterium]|nr:phytanoyl-CoA dioxygenase family protein [Gammaproteobacteria bacterium]